MLQMLATINEHNMLKAVQHIVKLSFKWVVLLPNLNPYKSSLLRQVSHLGAFEMASSPTFTTWAYPAHESRRSLPRPPPPPFLVPLFT